MNVFFCDIRGTFDSTTENRELKIKQFVNFLTKISQKLEIDDLIFRFITADDMDYLLGYVQELEPHTKNTPIRLTSQFSEHQKYKNGEIIDIPYTNKLDQIRYISEGRNVDKIFYADDSIQNQIIISKVLSILCPDAEIISFIPGKESVKNLEKLEKNFYTSPKKGIDGLIEIVSNYNELLTEKQLIKTKNKL